MADTDSQDLPALVLGASEVRRLLPMKDCIDVMDETLREMAKGEAGFPPRHVMPYPAGKGALGLMPGYLLNRKVLGVKVTTVYPGNLGSPYESHQGSILLFESEHGRLLAMVEAGEVTRLRTAAVTGVATRALANEDSSILAILGSGTQAAAHLDSLLLVEPGIGEVRVWSRDRGHARSFVDRESAKHGVDITVSEDPKSAVAGADVVCTVTGSATPILQGSWLGSGMHVNAVGASRPPNRELDSDAVARSRFFVDSRESANLEADDYRVPLRDGAVGSDHIRGEIGEVLTGKAKGRESHDDITLFKSLGLAIEDLGAAHYVYEKAVANRKGTVLPFSGLRNSK